jgi:hypothetical protein
MEAVYVKYIVFAKKMPVLTHYVPVIFPNALAHMQVAEDMLGGALNEYRVDSAGEWSPTSMECSGSSESLGVDSNSERDNNLIILSDYGSNFE